MTVSEVDAARIKKLLSYLFNDSIENKVRRILQEMPHLLAEEIAHAIRVLADRQRTEAAELAADAKIAHHIAEIIKEAEAFNLWDALQKLGNRASKGDTRARELQRKLTAAMQAAGVSVYDDDDLRLCARGSR